jgi:hypothetical protein
MPEIEQFLRQRMDESTSLVDTWGGLHELVAP